MQKEFQFNPDLKFIKENFQGNELVNGKFVNTEGAGPIGFSKVMKWMFSANPQRAEKKADQFRLKKKPDHSIFDSELDAFSWLGHASFLFRVAGKSILTDPCLRSLPGTKRLVSSPFEFSAIKNLDYILFSHSHRDHFDQKSVQSILEINPNVHFLVPLRMGKLLEKIGAKNITEAGWYQEYNLETSDGLRVVFLPAKHWNRRFTHDTNRELWGSFWIGSEKQSIYFAGDTAFDNHFTEIGNLFPEIQHAFMPIGAFKPDYIMKDAHIGPDEAMEAFHMLKAKNFIPMHHGTYDLSDEPIGEPSRTISQLHLEEKLKGNLILPAVGEKIHL